MSKKEIMILSNNPDNLKTQICHCCGDELPLNDFYIRKRRNKYTYETICKKCVSKRNKNYKENNKDKCNQLTKEWCEKNREKSNTIKKKYKEKHKNDPVYQSKVLAYCANRRAQKRNCDDETKDNNKIKEIYQEAKRLNIEAGYCKYHVDHIIPLSRGGKHHQDNLQIILAEENLKKYNKLPEELI